MKILIQTTLTLVALCALAPLQAEKLLPYDGKVNLFELQAATLKCSHKGVPYEARITKKGDNYSVQVLQKGKVIQSEEASMGKGGDMDDILVVVQFDLKGNPAANVLLAIKAKGGKEFLTGTIYLRKGKEDTEAVVAQSVTIR